MTETDIIRRCKLSDRVAQKLLYDKYAPKMLAVSRRYIRNRNDAEDVLVQAMYKVLTKLNQYSGEGNFEGWIRRIVVNEALMHLRKKKDLVSLEEVPNYDRAIDWSILEHIQAKDIIHLTDQMPPGYRTVFNMYVIEGYKHREIAEILGISVNTSKSQLILAKKKMKELLQKIGYNS